MSDLRDTNLAWLIWSNEHGKWWRPNERGYTPIIAEAGRYPKRTADLICEKANYRPGLINEVAVLAPESIDIILDRLADIQRSIFASEEAEADASADAAERVAKAEMDEGS